MDVASIEEVGELRRVLRRPALLEDLLVGRTSEDGRLGMTVAIGGGDRLSIFGVSEVCDQPVEGLLVLLLIALVPELSSLLS
jgi:hypothetical protein